MTERLDDASTDDLPVEPDPDRGFDDRWDDGDDDVTGDVEDAAGDRTPAWSAGWSPNGDDDTGATAGAVAPASPVERAFRRVFRRPTEWATRPWPGSRIVQYVVTVFTLTTTTVIMSNVVHLSLKPSRDLIFDDTTPTGGDFGAHVWGPAFLRDHLLPGWFNGWSMDWYAGMPVYRFYMVLPALAILLVNNFLAYGVAMKLVSILGVVTLPASCWAFGRLAKFRYPIPELMAFGGLAFVLDESFEIYGGNVKSTMAGEFSFSIALSLLMLALGVLAAGLRTGKYRVWASVLLAAAGVSHGIVLIYMAVAAVVFCAVWVDRQRWKYALTVGVTTVLLSMWWVGPFMLGHDFMTDMKYEGKPDWADSYWSMFFPHDTVLDFIISGLALLAFVLCIARRQLNGVALGVLCLIFIAGVYATRDSLPLIGLLWNPRLLPFVYLTRYLLMVIGAFELLALLWNACTDRRALQAPSVGVATAFFAVPAVSVLLVLGWMFQELPGGALEVKTEGQPAVYTWGPLSAPQGEEQTKDAQADGWASYNFKGYEGRQQYYAEYYNIVQTMARIGDDPERGCGRALWENNTDGNSPYGTSMALMLLPFWTDGCIGSMEGLYFEASGTTPYHFLTTSAMSEKSSNPVRQLRYQDKNAEVGVRHLQDLGVRYVMVRTDVAKQNAAARPELTLIGQSYPWDVYQVADSAVVEPLDVQPVVVNERGGDQRERNLELGTSWFQNPDEWAAMPANGGPEEWQRIDVAVDMERRSVNADGEKNQVDYVVPEQAIVPVELPEVTVSNVAIEQQGISFDVDQVGVPVLVKVSYFPNWEADGAEGPWRIGPNMMVVVPTDEHVELRFERTLTDYATVLLTLVGVGLCVFWRRQGDLQFDSEMPGALWRAPAGPGPDPEPLDLAAPLPRDAEVWGATGTPTHTAGTAAVDADVPADDGDALWKWSTPTEPQVDERPETDDDPPR